MIANFLILSNALIFKFFFFCLMCALRKNTRILSTNSSGFVIASIELCPPSAPPGSRQKTPGPDEV